MRTAQIGRPGEARTLKGLSLCERRKLRRQGFTEAEVAFLNALAEIRNFCEREEAMRRARPPESG